MKAQSQVHDDPRISAAAERQMQTWVRMQEMEDRVVHIHDRGQLAGCVLSYVAISREAGTDGAGIARMVGSRLGWEVYDKNLLDQVAKRYGESRLMLDLVDETRGNWVVDLLGAWMDRKIVTHDKYFAHVSRVIQSMSRHGKAVFVGRGAWFLLPRDKTLAVRLVAPERFRVERVMETRKLSTVEARKFVEETDRGRREFIEHSFRQNVSDPCAYDLVINVARLGSAGVVDQIVAAVCQGGRGGGGS